MKIFNLVFWFSIFGGHNLSDANEKSGNVEEQNHSTSSELSFEFGSTSSKEEVDEPPPPKRLRSRRLYSGRDCTWRYMEVREQGALQRQMSLYNVRRDGVNTGLCGVNPYESWHLFFTKEVIDKIVDYTNIKIGIMQNAYARERDAGTWMTQK